MALVSTIVAQVSKLLNDADRVRWPEIDLVYWVNEAIKQIVILMPDSNAVTQEIQLVAGTKQSLPADGIRLIDVLRNTGVAGDVPSSPIRIVERDILDTLLPNWHKDRSSLVAKNFVFDERNPKTFYVYPPSRAQFIDVVYSKMPTTLVLADDLAMFDIYSASIINYLLYRAYAKDTEEGSEARSRSYQQSFYTSIGLFDQADSKVKPNLFAPPRNKKTGESY